MNNQQRDDLAKKEGSPYHETSEARELAFKNGWDACLENSSVEVNKAQEEKIELIAVGLLDWVLHRFRTTEYDKDVLKWKWDQTLWSCQEIFEEYIREQGIDYKVPAAPPPDAGKEQEDMWMDVLNIASINEFISTKYKQVINELKSKYTLYKQNK